MSEKLHVLFLSMHYRPEPCDTRTSQLARSFAARGHRATALTSFPNYPFGKVYDGYRQSLVHKSKRDGVELVRVPMFADHSRSKRRRALSYLSFGLSSTILGALFTKRPNLIWIHHPPLTTGIAGWLLARIKRVPFVYEIHDLWPETLLSTGMIREGRITRAIRRVCNFLYRRADAIVVTSEGMGAHLEKQGVPAAKISVLPQWTDESTYRPVQRNLILAEKLGLAGKFNVFFTGNIGVAQGLDTVLDAAKRVASHRDIQIVLVGAGVELDRLKRRAEAENIRNVRFLGQFAPEEMPSLFAWADVSLLHLLNDPLFAITVPSKLQTYMAMGSPILCGVTGDASKIVEQAEAGRSFAPEDCADMADAIIAAFHDSPEERQRQAENSFRYYHREFAHEALVQKYEVLFHGILAGRRAQNRASAIIDGASREAAEPVNVAARG